MDEQLTKETVDLSAVRYDKDTGLVPVVVQDVDTGTVLMVAYANREAFKRTLATKQAWFWSRSRQDYWRKGATSGNVLTIVDVRVDCDGDTVLYLVKPAGPACHTGETTCFYRSVSHIDTADVDDAGEQVVHEESVVATSNVVTEAPASTLSSADTVQWDGERLAELNRLWSTVDERYRTKPEGSYTTYLYTQGMEKIGKKVGEEAVEVALASLQATFTGDSTSVASESADLLYHLFVLWRALGLSPETVLQKLAER